MKIDNSSSLAPTLFLDAYHELFYEKADPRIRDLPLMGNPLPIVLIYTCYAIFFKFFMPRIMRDRKPVDVRNYVYLLHVVLFFNSAFFAVWGLLRWPFSQWRCFALGTGNTGIDMEVSFVGLNKKRSKIIFKFCLPPACRRLLPLSPLKVFFHLRKCVGGLEEEHAADRSLPPHPPHDSPDRNMECHQLLPGR
jgi:hypothetical protein